MGDVLTYLSETDICVGFPWFFNSCYLAAFRSNLLRLQALNSFPNWAIEESFFFARPNFLASTARHSGANRRDDLLELNQMESLYAGITMERTRSSPELVY